MAEISPSDATQSPPRKAAGRGKFQRTVMALAHTLHIYTTLFAFLGLLLFSVSGFLLHHANWFYVSYKSQKDLHLPPELVSVPDDKLGGLKLQIAERVRTDGKISGAVKMAEMPDGQPDPTGGFNIDEKTITFTFAGPSRTADVTIYRVADDTHKIGDTHIDLENHGISGLLGDLHMGTATGPVWALVIDLVSLTLCFASLTGVLIWTQLSKRRTIGLLCMGLGTAIIVGIYIAFVP